MNRQSLKYFLSDPQPCAYLPDRQAVMAIIDPQETLFPDQFTQLAQLGFRRSGNYVYRPQCPGCQSCIPLRVAAADFMPGRTQRRVWRGNQDIRVSDLKADFDEQHFDLFQRYVNGQHQGGGMDNPEASDYLSLLVNPDGNTRLFEFHHGDRLQAVAITDLLEDGLSAVYTFYDPDLASRSPGVYTVLWQIEQCRKLGLDWLYLGYWISECRKMSYKDRYRPCETLTPEGWRPLA